MKITVKLNQGQLPKKYGKFGDAADFKGAYHWTAANVPGDLTEIPENSSQKPPFSMIQGKNSTASPYIQEKDPLICQHYVGPTPPQGIHNYELRIYALDQKLALAPGFWMNELLHAMEGHILTHQKIILPYRG